MLILHSGNLGQAIAERLQASHAATIADLQEAVTRLDQLLPGQDFVGLATWRPYPELGQQIDNACFAHGIRWSCVTLNEFSLICGPLVVPGEGACYHCHLQRQASHGMAPDWEQAVTGFYAEQPHAGPAGYPRALVEIGAAALAEDAVAQGVAARMRNVDILGAGVQESTVIGIHRCPRCRPRTAQHDPRQRSIEVLIPALKGLLDE